MKLSKHLKQIFWDVDPRVIDLKRHKRFIITRVAEKGAWADVVWLKKQFGVPTIKKTVKTSRNTSLKTKNFWQLV